MKKTVYEREGIDESSDDMSFRMPGSALTLFSGLSTRKARIARRLPSPRPQYSSREIMTTMKSIQFHLSLRYEL